VRTGVDRRLRSGLPRSQPGTARSALIDSHSRLNSVELAEADAEIRGKPAASSLFSAIAAGTRIGFSQTQGIAPSLIQSSIIVCWAVVK
jgi:hypothetical protein